MSISLSAVAAANFRTDYRSDRLNDDFTRRLGMRRRYLPARLAIARSLAMGVPSGYSSGEWESGKAIAGDMLFGTGTELSIWLALIVERSFEPDEPDVDVKRLIAAVSAHWSRGLAELDKEWRKANGHVYRFVRRLADAAELPKGGGRLFASDVSSKGAGVGKLISENSLSSGEIKVPLGELGEDAVTGEKAFWSLNDKGGSPHSAIMGASGSGKTLMATAMLRAIREQARDVPILAFDFKGDLAEFTGMQGETKFGDAFGAEEIEPPNPIPLDVLSLSKKGAYEIGQAAMRFRESFSNLKRSRLGDIQRNYVYEAARRALSSNNPCTLDHIRNCLNDVYEENEAKRDGAFFNMEDLCRNPFFEPKFSPAEFFRRSRIVKLPLSLPESSRMIVVNLLLDALGRHLSDLPDADPGPDGFRGLRILCMIDEAHQILGARLPSLSNLIRTSRSKGGAVMLVSQSPDDFSGEDDEFLDNMGFVAAFGTNAKPNAVARILGKQATNLTNLEKGQCFAKFDRKTRKIRAYRHKDGDALQAAS